MLSEAVGCSILQLQLVVPGPCRVAGSVAVFGRCLFVNQSCCSRVLLSEVTLLRFVLGCQMSVPGVFIYSLVASAAAACPTVGTRCFTVISTVLVSAFNANVNCTSVLACWRVLGLGPVPYHTVLHMFLSLWLYTFPLSQFLELACMLMPVRSGYQMACLCTICSPALAFTAGGTATMPADREQLLTHSGHSSTPAPEQNRRFQRSVSYMCCVVILVTRGVCNSVQFMLGQLYTTACTG